MTHSLIGLPSLGDAEKGLEFVVGDILRPILVKFTLDGPVVAVSGPSNEINSDLWLLETKFVGHLSGDAGVVPDLS